MPRGISTQVLGGFKTGMDRQTKRGGKDGAQRLWTLENAYLNERGDAVPRPGLQHVANVAHSAGLYGWQGQLHVFHGESDFVDPGNPLVAAHWVRYPYVVQPLTLSGHLPAGLPGSTVSYQYTITNGVPPYAVGISAGALPAGLSMNSTGLVTGQFADLVTANWTVEATDANGEVVTLDDSYAAIAAYSTWDSMTLPTAGSLSTDKSTLSASAGTAGCVLGTGPIIDKRYFEMQVATIAGGDTAEAGLACSDFDRRSNYVGLSANTALGVQCRNGLVISGGVSKGTIGAGALGASMRLRFAVDGFSRAVWVGAIGQSGWVGGGDPSTGASPTYTMPGSGRIWPAASITTAGATVKCISDPTMFSGVVPSGFVGGLLTMLDAGGFATLDPQATHANNTLSSGNLTATNTGSALVYAWTASTRVKRSGKPYWEVTAKSGVTSQDRCIWGVDTEGGDYLRYFNPQALLRGYGIGSSGAKFSGTTATALTAGINTGDIIRNRMDIAAGTYEIAVNGGAWMTIATGITGPGWRVVLASYYGTFFPEGGTFNFGASAFAYPVPTGYDAGWLKD